MTNPIGPVLMARALWLAPCRYSLARLVRMRSLMNGMMSSASFSPCESGAGTGVGSALCTGAGGDGDVAGNGGVDAGAAGGGAATCGAAAATAAGGGPAGAFGFSAVV